MVADSSVSSPSRHSMDSDANARKRVCKACDRCRLKKSKCDGANPCSRCKQDNAICVFGERKKSHDKVYPKGYVEMLEQQQSQLVAGLRELYRKLQAGENWPGAALDGVHDGHPLTHDILERLDLLHASPDSPIKQEGFEEDLTRLQQRLIDNGASFVRRRGSVSSDSDPGMAHSEASHDTPPMPAMSFVEPFLRNRAPPTPPDGSPFPRPSQLSIPVKQQFTPQTVAPTFTPQQLLQQQWMASPTSFDVNMEMDLVPSYDPSMNFEYNQFTTSPMPLGEFGGDDFDSFINFQAMASQVRQG